jgi:hypothetical protein
MAMSRHAKQPWQLSRRAGGANDLSGGAAKSDGRCLNLALTTRAAPCSLGRRIDVREDTPSVTHCAPRCRPTHS